MSFDPVKQIAVIGVLELPMVVTLVSRQPVDRLAAMVASGEHPKSEFARMEGTPYGMRREPLLSPFGTPCTAPPWGKLVALDMADHGRRLWKRPIGTTAGMAPISLEVGMPFQGGPATTAGGLVFMAATVDDMLRAYNRDSSKVLWEVKLPAGGNATPSVYEAGGSTSSSPQAGTGGSGPSGATMCWRMRCRSAVLWPRSERQNFVTRYQWYREVLSLSIVTLPTPSLWKLMI